MNISELGTFGQSDIYFLTVLYNILCILCYNVYCVCYINIEYI